MYSFFAIICTIILLLIVFPIVLLCSEGSGTGLRVFAGVLLGIGIVIIAAIGFLFYACFNIYP